VIANKAKLGADTALELADRVSSVNVFKGKKITTFDMRKAPPGKDEFLAAVLGATGNLRAPTIKKGKTLLVGFNEEAFEKFFG
jgi:arsenate reductase-like glutaredoxin family protein